MIDEMCTTKGVFGGIKNNSFRYLNNTIRVSKTLFYLHVFPKNLNNITRTILPNKL